MRFYVFGERPKRERARGNESFSLLHVLLMLNRTDSRFVSNEFLAFFICFFRGEDDRQDFWHGYIREREEKVRDSRRSCMLHCLRDFFRQFVRNNGKYATAAARRFFFSLFVYLHEFLC